MCLDGRAVGENMTQFPKIQARLDAAIAIIENASAGGADPAEVEKLSQDVAKATKATKAAQDEAASAAEALKTARARVETLEKELAEKADSAEAGRTAMIKQIDALDKARTANEEELAKTKQYNKHLKKLNTSLRKANEDNVGDPELINQSLEAELEQIKAQRDVDLAEVNGILARLTPLVEGA